MADKILLALSTFPDTETARRISNQLVTERFVACANILAGVESIYRWNERIEIYNETLVLIKLSEDGQAAVEEKLRTLHPYEVPEIVCFKTENGCPALLNSVAQSCAS